MKPVTGMKAIEIAPGGGAPDVLRLVERPLPAIGEHDVLIQVHAAGVNGHDLHQRSHGAHPLQPGETDLPGLEVAGTVIGRGSSVLRWREGDAVCALLRGGGYAQFAAAHEDLCLPVPAGMGMVEAASLPEACFTVWSNVFEDAGLREGDTFLMNGGSSGIGITAIQLAKAAGARVFATAGGENKCRLCEALGAERAIDYTHEDAIAVLQGIPGYAGVDVVLDIVAGDNIARNMALLRQDGRLVVIGAARGSHVSVDLEPVVRKRLKLTGSLLRPRPLAYKKAICQSLRARVWPQYEQGVIRPVIDTVFHLSDAAQAHARMESRLHAGKIVLQLDL